MDLEEVVAMSTHELHCQVTGKTWQIPVLYKYDYLLAEEHTSQFTI